MDFGIAGVAAITVICYLAGQAVKATPLASKWVPVICGALGGVMGIIACLTMESFPGEDPLTSIAIGIVSGLAATGANQIYKQMKGDNGT